MPHRLTSPHGMPQRLTSRHWRTCRSAIGNCAYLSTMLEAADLYLRMGYHQKEARDMTTRVLKAGPTHSQQRHATKILHQVLEPTAAPQGAVALPHEVAMGAAATAASEGAHHEVPTPPPAAAAPATAVMVLPPARVHAHAPVELPVGWAHFLTPDGDAYFHCEATGETLWEPPASSHTYASPAALGLRLDASTPGLTGPAPHLLLLTCSRPMASQACRGRVDLSHTRSASRQRATQRDRRGCRKGGRALSRGATPSDGCVRLCERR